MEQRKRTPQYIYVSNPARGGGLHNYGMAVDISIVDAQGQPLPMGTPVDYLGKEAHITEEEQLVRTGKLTIHELENRRLLRKVMKEAGFRTLPSEWCTSTASAADSQKEVPDNSLKPQQSPFPASPDAFHLTSSD